MADKKMYKVGITVKEPWSADISYEVLDITLYAVENGGDGCSYIAIRANQGVTPGTDDTVWVKATQRGQSIYDLAVKYGDFEGTEAEFEAEYEAAVHAAQSAAQSASDIEAQVETNEAARVTAERARSDAETARSSAETARINAENARNDAESLRDTAESDRVRAEAGRVTAEASRVEAETFRQGAEQSRRQQFEGLKTDMETAIDNVDAKSAEIAEDIEGYEANEAGRVSAENARATAESARVSAEQGRATAETARQTAEGNRATAETERASAEGARATAEQGRVSAEQGRVSAESDRVSAESERVAAETARESASATAVQNAETATAAANTAAEHAEEAAATIDAKIAGKADESEVSQLRSELEGGETTVTDADVTSAAGRWTDNNGVIGTATSGALHRAEVIDLTGIVSFSLTTDMSWAAENAAYLCDDSGNIIETIPRLVSGDPTVITDKAVPDGVTKIYINFATTFELNKKSLVGIEEKFDNKLQSLEVDVNQYQEQYGARDIVDNTSPIELSEDDFVLGNLNGNTGAEISATNVVRSSFIEVVPGAGFTFQTSNSYRCDIFMYDADKAFIAHFSWRTGTYTNTLNERASYIRIVLASPSGTSTAPVWEDAALSVTIVKKYVPTRAVGKDEVRGVVEGYFDIELPILAPSPQLPANDSQEADFNAETVTSADIHNALDALINSISSPTSGVSNSPKFLTKYEVSGIDASDVYPIRTYAMGLRNRYAWRFANELYAWKDGDNIVFLDSCSPRVGDTIYSDSSRTNSGKTVVSYNSGTGTMVDSASASYTRSETDNVSANMFWTKRATYKSDTTSTIIYAFNRADVSIGSATYVDATHLSLGGKTYTRSECFDYHSEQKGTIFIWGNEHGPTSDPLEPSIILYRLAKDLCGGCRNNPFLMFIKQYFKIVFIPCANPWGCQYPRVNGRVNSNGVNINRNYDTPGWSVVADTDKGSYAGDQNETQYIMNMCKRFAPDISIDIHCLGFGNDLAEGLMYLSETAIPDNAAYLRTQNVLSGLGFLFDKRGNPMPESGSHGSEWLDYHDMIGGVFEMNAGAYSLSHIYDGKQHSASVMEADYTELLNCIRMWIAEYDPTIDLTKMCIK